MLSICTECPPLHRQSDNLNNIFPSPHAPSAPPTSAETTLLPLKTSSMQGKEISVSKHTVPSPFSLTVEKRPHTPPHAHNPYKHQERMQEVHQQHTPDIKRRLTQQLIGHKRKSYMHRDETIVPIPDNMKEVLFTLYLRNHDWRYIKDRQTEFADKGFIKPLLKLLNLCGPDIQTICDLTVGCGGALLPLLHARPDLRAVAFDQSSQCIKALLHNAGCLNLNRRLTARCERSETMLHLASDWCVAMLDVPWTSKLKLGRFELIDVVRELFENGLRRLILTVPYHYDYRQLIEYASSMYVFPVGGAKAILLLL